MIILIRICTICGETLQCYVDGRIRSCEHCYQCDLCVETDRLIAYKECKDCTATIKRLPYGQA